MGNNSFLAREEIRVKEIFLFLSGLAFGISFLFDSDLFGWGFAIAGIVCGLIAAVLDEQSR